MNKAVSDTTEPTAVTAMDPGGRRARSENPRPQLQPGEVIGGRYEVDALLGVGGYGEVYRVRDQKEGDRAIALKLHRIGRIRRRALDALKAEFALLASLEHPNLARVYDFAMSERGYGFFTQELVEGSTLDKDHALTTPQGTERIAQVLRALDFLHARGIVHGDIKPSNLLVDSVNERVVMLDFGVTRTLGTSTRDLRGSPTYMAPELIRGWTIDGRADLYSLGVTLYRLLMGVFPFDGPSTSAIFDAHLAGQYAPITGVPEALGDWVHRLLERDPRKRPASARQALVGLSRATGHDVPLDTQATLASHVSFAPFIPRGTMLDQLESMSIDRGVRVALLEGEPGTGKTRTLHELRQRLQLDGAHWMQLTSTRETGVPLDTKLALSFLDPIERKRLRESERRALARAIPSLRKKRERLAEPLDPERAAHARRQLVGEVLARSSRKREGTMVVAIEDLQWASTREQTWLVEVLSAAHQAAASLLVVATARPGGVDSSWARLRPRFFRSDNFSPSESKDFASALLGDVSCLHGTAFYSRMEDAPAPALWLQESLRLACDEGVLVRGDEGFERRGTLDAVDLPDILLRRVQRLTRGSRDIAAALASLGEQAELADLVQVSGRRPQAVAVAVEELLRHGVVARTQDGDAMRLRMHDRFVDAIVNATSLRKMRAVRRRAARWSERRSGDDPEALVGAAELYAAAERPADMARVLHAALGLADAAGRPDAGLRIIDAGRKLGEDFQSHYLLAEFDMSIRVGDRGRAEAALWRAQRAGLEPSEIAWRRARLEFARGEFEMARARVLPHIEESEGLVRTELLLALGDIEFARANVEEALSAYSDAASAAEEHDLPGRQARALLGRSQAEGALQRGDAGWSAKQAAAAARRARDPGLAADARRHIGLGHVRSRNYVAAERSVRSALVAARNAGAIAAEADALADVGRIARLRGRVGDAITALRRSVRLKRKAGLYHSAQQTLVSLASLLRATGDIELAEDLLARYEPTDRRDRARGLAAILRGDLNVLRGDWGSAWRYDQAAQVLSFPRDQEAMEVANDALARCALAEGRPITPPRLQRNKVSPSSERRRLVTRALALAANGRSGVSVAKKAAAIRAGDELFATFFGTRLEALWVNALCHHWSGKDSSKLVARAQRSLKRTLEKYEPEAPSLLRANAVFGAIEAGVVDLPPGRSW